MTKFYLKKLTITGENKKPSSITFEKGLNIIHGISDTGKTCVLKCIDFVFGGKNKYPIPEIHGYDTVALQITTENGEVVLKREIGKNKIHLISSDSDFPSSDYNLNEIGDILLPLIGIKNMPLIIKNSKYEKQRLTWRTFMHTFVITEEEIIQTAPILVSKESTARTASLSALIYLLTAVNFDTITPQEDEKIKEARKRAVEKYISGEISDLNIKKQKLDKLLGDIDKEYIESIIQKLSGELSEIEHNISRELNKQNNLFSQIVKVQDAIAECDVRLDKYTEFRSQCLADIERLGFIVDAENNITKIPKLDKCPYCDTTLPQEQEESYIETANNELKRILELLKGLEKTNNETKNEKMNLSNELSNLLRKKEAIDNYVRDALKPKQRNVQKMLNDYRTIIKLQNEFELVDNLQQEKYNELTLLSQQDEEKIAQYKPKEHFPIGFQKDFTETLNTILQECKYEDLQSVFFNIDDFDAIVNLKEKSNFGKGFRAFINMGLVLALRKYLVEKGKFAPRLLAVDSPLLSLEQGVSDESAPESMKAALITYLMKTQEEGQTIIIENKIPELNYKEYNVNLIEFTKGKKAGRYGLLLDVTTKG